MKNVRRIFFLDEAETEQVRLQTHDKYILNNHPHYELEDGTILYSCGGISDYAVDVVVRPPTPLKEQS